MMNTDRIIKSGVLGVFFLLLTSCAPKTVTKTVVEEVIVSRNNPHNAPGVVEYVWEEPMVNVIDVPPGLDPEGVYYRPAHQAIMEIRQGRWQYIGAQDE